MKDIDFLPSRYREQRAMRKAKLWQLGVVASFGLAVCAAAGGQTVIRQGFKQQLTVAAARSGDATMKLAQVTQLRMEVDAAGDEAELVTYLRRQWPQTQLLADIVRQLPESLALTELTIAEEKTKVDSPLAVTQGEDTTEPERTAARRDLIQLRQQHDADRTVILLTGIARNSRDLHEYVARLRHGALYEEAKLESLESLSAEESEVGAGSSFLVRVLVLQDYGQPRGPTLDSPVDALAKDSIDGDRT